MLRFTIVLAALGATVPAFAEPTTTASLQPMVLVVPMIDATIEHSPTPHLGLAVRGGYGHVGIPLLAGASIYEVGGAANWYVTRPFSGWHVGAQAVWAWGDASGLLGTREMSTTTSPERIVGAYGGYKWIGWHGATAVLQVGVGHLDQKSSPDGPISKVEPVANGTIGWSF